VTRLLHADGVALDALGVGQGPLSEDVARAVWRRLCERWHLHRGNAGSAVARAELAEIFDVTLRPAAETADAIYDQVAERLAQDAYRARCMSASASSCSQRRTTRVRIWPPMLGWPLTRRGRGA
jgi:glucuronate isomerase